MSDGKIDGGSKVAFEVLSAASADGTALPQVNREKRPFACTRFASGRWRRLGPNREGPFCGMRHEHRLLAHATRETNELES